MNTTPCKRELVVLTTSSDANSDHTCDFSHTQKTKRLTRFSNSIVKLRQTQGRLTQRARRARVQGPEPQGPQTAHALFFLSREIISVTNYFYWLNK